MIELTGRLTMTPEQIEAFGRLTEAASQGDGAAACILGDMFREGRGGLRYSPKLTFHCYSRSALAGDRNGQNNLGACYEHGLGCAQSYAKAVKWYRLSAAQRLGTASMNLGYCYLYGHGVPADKGEAVRLFRLAVEQGEGKAAEELERLGEPVREKTVTKASSVRIVDETQPGKHLGLVGAGGTAPPPSDEAPTEVPKSGWTAEDSRRAWLGAWEKDDCFDLPDPDSPYGRRLKAEGDESVARLIRRGLFPSLEVELGESSSAEDRTCREALEQGGAEATGRHEPQRESCDATKEELQGTQGGQHV